MQNWGGPIDLSSAFNNPENVKRIIILNTWLWPVDHDWYYIAFSKFVGGIVSRFLIKQFNFFVRVIMPQSYGDRSKLTKKIHQHYLKPLGNPQARKGCSILPGEIISSASWLNDLWKKRIAIKDVPKLIVWGMKDIAFREKELNTWVETYPDSRVICLNDVGHYVQEEGKAELAIAVNEFLN